MSDHREERPRISTAEAMQRTGFTRSYLTLLLRTNKLEGFRYPDTTEWFVYIDSLDTFLATPRKPGPKGPRKPKRET
jgi:hypothetical protein